MNTEKNRILTHVETIGNNGTSRLPSLLSKSTVCLSNSKPESPLFKRRRTRQKDNLNASTSKIERQTTNLASPTRLPPLNTTNNDGTLKQKADLQRRQIYALNHLMRELEQEQFRLFCQANGIGTTMTKPEEIISNNEQPVEQANPSV